MEATKPEVPKPVQTDESQDKRRHLRVPLRVLRVETKLKGDVFFGHATNISKTGLFIQTANPKQPGFKVHIKFQLPNSEKLSCWAEVVWTQDYTGQKGVQPGMGLQFIDPPESVQSAINEFAKEAQEE